MALEILFWLSAALIVYAHVGYALVLRALTALLDTGDSLGRRFQPVEPVEVDLIIAAYDEDKVIERKVANALALDYPAELLRVVVASTARRTAPSSSRGRRSRPRARPAPRRQGGGAERGGAPDAGRSSPSRTPTASGTPTPWPGWWRVCGRKSATPAARFASAAARRQPGGSLLALRDGPARDGVRAGRHHGGQRRHLRRPPRRLHRARSQPRQDIGFPFEITKRGRRAVYEPTAVAEERMAPTVEGEFKRKRRMMWGLWDVMLRWGMLNPRGYSPAYAFEIYSHRLCRYLTPGCPDRPGDELRPAGTGVAVCRHGAAAGAAAGGGARPLRPLPPSASPTTT